MNTKPESISVYLEKAGAPAEKYAGHPALLLWDDNARVPGFTEGDAAPTLTPYLMNSGNPAVLVVANRLNETVAANEEKEAVEFITAEGMNAFVLNYRADEKDLSGEKARQDIARAVRFIRYYSSEFDVSYVGAIGFEYGAEVLMLNGDDSPNETSVDDIDGKKSIADFQVLGNPSGQCDAWPAFSESYPISFFYYTVGSPIATGLLEAAENAIKPAGTRFEIHGFTAASADVTGLGSDDVFFSRVKQTLDAWIRFNKFN